MDSSSLVASYYAEVEYLCDNWAKWARLDSLKLVSTTNVLYWAYVKKSDLLLLGREPNLPYDVCFMVDTVIAKLPQQQKRAIVLKHLTYAPVKVKAKRIRVGVKRYYDLVTLGYRRVYTEINLAS